MEIERKFLIRRLPENYTSCPFRQIEQGYLNMDPVVRIRRDSDQYYLTYKSSGFLTREEYNFPINKESYLHMRDKTDGFLITKKRYLIPYQSYMIELDIFENHHAPLILAEVEFPTEQEALAFEPPAWFCRDVTTCPEYTNSYLSRHPIC